MTAVVTAVASGPGHTFSKPVRDRIELLTGLGVAGDAHLGSTVQHRSRVARDPGQPNLRQVHLIHDELLEELRAAGFTVGAGDLGENILTHGLDVLALPTGTRLRIGVTAAVEVTGLRNPCQQLNDFQPGLLAAVLHRDADGRLIRRAGIMGVVLADGPVRPGDPIAIETPPPPHHQLAPV
jgi:MOSC domain-containing protein YiiM